ncbi:MAG: 3-hydroxybutyryl-CoA dehydrogenase [Bacteroidetes bacterium]|jgi:3-hydroxybutyryl-CoA dehydrogenase|nr:3-hydroxybutyryl-CoA dehydrogenase [Bacteroidota bacterium]
MISVQKVGVAGAGSMGTGIAQVAATAGCEVFLFDTNKEAIDKSIKGINDLCEKLFAKGKLSREQVDDIKSRVNPAYEVETLKGCDLFIEAIIENLEIKSSLLKNVEPFLADDAIIATNTSSLSVTAIAAACKIQERVIGLHFFNPATLMPLVEVIPAIQSIEKLVGDCVNLMTQWGKVPVVAKDTPGFIVNRVARPFYGESLRILEEGIADVATIDWALKTMGGFKMGPFELMDLIGNDINYTVTETVWTQMYFDARYRPSLIQKKMKEAGRLGRKSGRGYYEYGEAAIVPAPQENLELGEYIFTRVISMLINEAVDAMYLKIASRDELDLAMTKGVNYPKGLLKWADEIGIKVILSTLDGLHKEYGEDRYRASIFMRKMAIDNLKFYK